MMIDWPDKQISKLVVPMGATASMACELTEQTGAGGPINAGLTLFPGRLPGTLAKALDDLPTAALPNIHIDHALVSPLSAFLDQAKTAAGMDRSLALVLDDVGHQLRRFVGVTGTRSVALKLERVEDDACRKLHHDYVAQRLVVTYRGRGTQWLPRAYEPVLGDERLSVPDEWLREVPRFTAALFAGRLLPGGSPVLHRSPPILGTGQVRLVLTINEPFAARH